MKRPTAQEMEMEVRDRLPAIPSMVRHDSIPRPLHGLRLTQSSGRQEETTRQFQMRRLQRRHRGNMRLRNQQEVRRGLRMDIAETQDPIVLIDPIRRDLPGNDPTKDAGLEPLIRHIVSLQRFKKGQGGPCQEGDRLRVHLGVPSNHGRARGLPSSFQSGGTVFRWHARLRAVSILPPLDRSRLVDSIPEQALGLLRRSPSPALPLGELRTLLTGTFGGFAPSEERLLQEMRQYPELFRLIEAPESIRRFGSPRAWVLTCPDSDDPPPPSLARKLRASLQGLGDQVDCQSLIDLARWERLLREEGRVRAALSRRRRPGGEGP